MNRPPEDGIRVDANDLRALVAAIFGAVPTPESHAALFADLLVETDLRGVVSHGVIQVERYVSGFQEGRVNPDPSIEVLRQGPTTAALNGDGCLGILVADKAMRLAIKFAREMGLGAVTTTYHYHVGSAGKFVRLALRENMVGICLSGRSAAPQYDHAQTVRASVQGAPPMAVGAPAGDDHPDFLLDMSTVMLDGVDYDRAAATYFKSIGLAHVSNILSGALGGQMLPQFDRQNVHFGSADQSGFFLALDVDRFTPLSAFLGDMDHLMAEVALMRPLPDCETSDLPGGLEWRREQQYAHEGVPVGLEAVASLERLALEFDLSVPW